MVNLISLFTLLALASIKAILPVDAKYGQGQQKSPGLEKLTTFSTITVSLYLDIHNILIAIYICASMYYNFMITNLG